MSDLTDVYDEKNENNDETFSNVTFDRKNETISDTRDQKISNDAQTIQNEEISISGSLD